MENNQPEADHDGDEPITVMNPPGTVAVTVDLDGSVSKVKLSGKVAGMKESDLAAEIQCMADLAWQQAMGKQHGIVSRVMRQAGLDDDDRNADVLENLIRLPSPDQADAARAEVFATRYVADATDATDTADDTDDF